MRWQTEAAALAALLALSGCGGRYAKTGLASWYGEELAGRPTASGERFDPAGFTAAHRRLPLGSLAQVTDLSTGRSILVRINDRGPYRHGRLIDLSRGSAQLLGTDRRAVAKVRVRAVSRGKPGMVIARGRGDQRTLRSEAPRGKDLIAIDARVGGRQATRSYRADLPLGESAPTCPVSTASAAAHRRGPAIA